MADRQPSFLGELIKELMTMNLTAFINLPGSLFIVLIVMILDNNLGNTDAKGYFLLGVLIMTILFYSVGKLMFEREEKYNLKELKREAEAEGKPTLIYDLYKVLAFLNSTKGSYFLFITGFFIAYWARLSIVSNASNMYLLLTFYIGLGLVLFIISTFILKSHSWKAGFISVMLGIIMGMLWAITIVGMIKNIVPPPEEKTCKKQQDPNLRTGTCSGDPNTTGDDMVCQAFRIA